MRAEEIRELSAEDLAARVRELEEERFRLRFRSATEPLEDPLRLRSIRKDIARLKTVLREQQMKGAGAESAAPAARTTAGRKAPAKRAAAKKAAAKKKTTRAAR